MIGVLIFAGLTAYDTQRLKEMYLYGQLDGEAAAALGDHGRAVALPGLHQHVPDAAAAARQPRGISRSGQAHVGQGPGYRRGLFHWGILNSKRIRF